MLSDSCVGWLVFVAAAIIGDVLVAQRVLHVGGWTEAAVAGLCGVIVELLFLAACRVIGVDPDGGDDDD